MGIRPNSTDVTLKMGLASILVPLLLSFIPMAAVANSDDDVRALSDSNALSQTKAKTRLVQSGNLMLPALLRGLDNHDPSVRSECLDILKNKKISDSNDIRTIGRKGRSDPDEMVRLDSIATLRAIRNMTAINELRTFAETDPMVDT